MSHERYALEEQAPIPVDPAILSGCQNLDRFTSDFLRAHGVSDEDVQYATRIQRLMQSRPNVVKQPDGTYIVPRAFMARAGLLYESARIDPIRERKLCNQQGSVVCRFPNVTFFTSIY